MSAASPQERDLAIGRHAVMAEAFELLADHLGPFIDERMAEYFSDEPSWAEAAANRLGRPAEHGATDPLFQLLVLRRFWGPVFADFFGQDLRQMIGQLIETRNMWAHFSFPNDPEALQRSVLAIERILAPVEPEVAGRLRQLRSRVDDPDREIVVAPLGDFGPSPVDTDPSNVGTAAPTEAASQDKIAAISPTKPPTKSHVAPRPPIAPPPKARVTDVNVERLEAQLSETETVFRELQSRYGNLEAELQNTRRITATKQLRLTAVERQLLEAEDHSIAVEEDLLEERITRHHIEWLIVGLLATLLLFMVLANT